ncbi:hypothetical protein GCM10011578_095290 [Streptomyces fuscichromogenes]|uniref:Uncharacterized protein n=1 Tax=Streptomyces fuscichromogenes TaxID=1324013 RepID=A0A917XPJ8_9ACTN|nr:hypothetical protein GCM10011578_095290 [Streptomyces fuscichromogenes]
MALGAEGAGDGQAQLGAGSDDGDAAHSDPFVKRGGKRRVMRRLSLVGGEGALRFGLVSLARVGFPAGPGR